MTLLLRGYAAIAPLALPRIAKRERAKLEASGMAARFPEKLGEPTRRRPDGKLLWVHAASVGESLSALALIDRFVGRATVLVTTGTATSAELMTQRLPDGAFHQFAPLDAPAPVARFLDHWQPDACLFIESEIWPMTLQAIAQRELPLALANARLSNKSLNAWKKRPKTARELLRHYKLILTQDATLATSLENLGAPKARAAQDLKSMANPLPVDQSLVELVPPKAWVAASTHPGEEELILNAHAVLLEYHPNLTLILAPRHPERGAEVAELVAKRSWAAPRRSQGDGPNGPVWLVDTLGELGSLYQAAPIVFLGGSLKPMGGHNPYEPAHAGAAIITGPHIQNFEKAFEGFFAQSAAQSVGNAQDLADKVGNLVTHPPLLHIRREASKAMSGAQSEGLAKIDAELSAALGL
ncbi:MAG: 3-deoxy-D-manno-octulosonic acid transferase [Pseudomonadota bacterium]